MPSIAIASKKKKQYTLSDFVLRTDRKDIDRIYNRAIKKADKMQADMLKRAAKIK